MGLREAALLTIGLAMSASVAGCGTQRVALLSTAGIPVTATPAGGVPLEVVTRGTAVPDPLRVRGSSVAYGDVEAALGLAISSAGVPWAEAHRAKRPEGWQLFVELTRAEADETHGRLIVTLDVRAREMCTSRRRRRTAGRRGSSRRPMGGRSSTRACRAWGAISQLGLRPWSRSRLEITFLEN